MSHRKTFEMKKISLFIDCDMFNEVEGEDVILQISMRKLYLICKNKTHQITLLVPADYLYTCRHTCLEGILKRTLK